MELLTVTALIGVFASIALPIYQDFSVQAKVSEGLLIFGELRSRVSVGYRQDGNLGVNLPASPPPDGTINGGPFYKYATLFGAEHYMWDQIEYQPKGPHRVIALRAHRRGEWGNTDIGIHLQIRVRPDNTLDFRCTTNEVTARDQYVPFTCRDGNVDDWTNW